MLAVLAVVDVLDVVDVLAVLASLAVLTVLTVLSYVRACLHLSAATNYDSWFNACSGAQES